ncbi:MAG: XdhC family protein [Candidatus Acetothermia bacterium]|jgi:xanthine dehydrogenase accessory factor|nr:XdhC family protein [Candidatus Acetothermia bacterium]MDH7504652.1 XdhC family protein [Candidatus Acetothermia bacterium]
MRSFYDRVAELLEEGRALVLAHLAEARGPAPQRAGAKLIVHPDGTTEFTVGGGALEMHVVQEALRLFPETPPVLKDYALRDLGMHCGGEVSVFYEAVRGPEMRQFCARVQELLREGGPIVIAHLFSRAGPSSAREARLILSAAGEPDSCCGVGPSPQIVERISAEAAALLPSGKRAALKELADPQGEGRFWAFLEVVERPPRLLIFGAGHVGAKLVKLAAATELFEVEVADEREDLLEPLRPLVDRVHLVGRDFQGNLPLPDERSFVAIVTHSHQVDAVVLRQILDSGRAPAYLGMIGSPKKRDEIFRQLGEEGIARARLSGVHTPIGLPIGGKEPGEIAVSILAEMIKVKNAREEH